MQRNVAWSPVQSPGLFTAVSLVLLSKTKETSQLSIVTFPFYFILSINNLSPVLSQALCLQFMQSSLCQQTFPWTVIIDAYRLSLRECELQMFSVTLYNWTHKGTLMSWLLSLSRVSSWLLLPSLRPIVSPFLLLSLLSRHWPLSLFLLIQRSPLSLPPLYHPLPSDLSCFFLSLWGPVPSAPSSSFSHPTLELVFSKHAILSLLCYVTVICVISIELYIYVYYCWYHMKDWPQEWLSKFITTPITELTIEQTLMDR